MATELYLHPLFQSKVEHLSTDERVSLSYQRARLVMQTYRLTVSDIQFCSSNFWAMMNDPICSLDIAMFTILAAHVGLTIGTLSRYLKQRPDLRPLVNRLLRFDTVGIYLLTERGHGLDAQNIETTAIKTNDGYILNTPREEAAKFMPPSTPSFGFPKVALVMARLIVDGHDRGSRFFIVPICNEHEMFQGVESIRLPPRSGTGPLDFSITRFRNVHLPATALVGADILSPVPPSQSPQAWWDEVWRIQLGTMAVPAPWISAIKAVAYIGGCYSMHRCITGKHDEPVPIISFRTQQWPVAHATAVGMVMANWYPSAVQEAMKSTVDPRIRHAMSVILKTTICRHFQRCVPEVAERCGAQGTFEQNYMALIENDGKGVIIAEGDVLTLCIRLLSELLLQRYQVPLPDAEESLLAWHATSLLHENMRLLKALKGDHRSDSFNSLILPQSQNVVEAIGHALAYSAALKAKLPQPILDVYECAVIRQDPAWYSEEAYLSRMKQRIREDAAISSILPDLASYISQLNIEKYVSAPIVSDVAWKEYLRSLPVHCGTAIPNVEPLQAML
ncbi:acyl-CoA oxidase [Tricholoma matsutake]|nr:acyl-CoA oxidase [Tricholoma matsutake 945]